MSLENYDRDKFVVLVCAGPSARNVDYSKNYYTAGVNVTPALIEQTDFWIMNDACYLSDFPSEKYRSIKNLALPEFPHTVNGVNYEPQINYNYLSVTRVSIPETVNIFPFNIQSAKRFNLPYNKNYPFFEVKSSSEVSFKWLIYKGFKKFITLGHDPDGGYHHDQYSKPTRSGGREVVNDPIDNERYMEVHQRMRAAIQDSGATWLRILLPPETSFNTDLLEKIKDTPYDETGYAEVRL